MSCPLVLLFFSDSYYSNFAHKEEFFLAHFHKSGSVIRVSDSGSDILDQLPVGNYVLKVNHMTGFYLDMVESFKLPDKIYGDCTSNATRVLNTYRDRARNTGVLLVGQKGSGKTLLMRKISIDSNLPVIIINSNFTGDTFNSFLSSITQPCIILFDEFEKIYDRKSQEQVLTLFDGTYQSNKLFLITSNNKWTLDDNMKNRPGRIYYLFEFGGLGEAFIREYCEDNLQDKSKINKIIVISKLFLEFNFDMLHAVVEETNRYGDEPSKLLNILNTKPEYSDEMTYDVTINIGDLTVPTSALNSGGKVRVNPFMGEWSISVYFCWSRLLNEELEQIISNEIDDRDTPHTTYQEWLRERHIFFGRSNSEIPRGETSYDYLNLDISPDKIVRSAGGSVTFQHENGFIVTLSRSKQPQSVDVAYSML